MSAPICRLNLKSLSDQTGMNYKALKPNPRTGNLSGRVHDQKSLNGHFDGEHIVLDDKTRLQPNIRVKITILKKALTKTQAIAVSRAAQYPFSKIR